MFFVFLMTGLFHNIAVLSFVFILSGVYAIHTDVACIIFGKVFHITALFAKYFGNIHHGLTGQHGNVFFHIAKDFVQYWLCSVINVVDD